MKKLALLFVSFVALVGQAVALDSPRLGLTYNTKENSSITYSCEVIPQDQIRCELVQISVRKKAKPEDLSARLEVAKKGFLSGNALDQGSCDMNTKILSVLEGKTTAPKGDFSKMTSLMKKDYINMAKAWVTACKSKTEKDFLNFVRIEHEKSTRTCRVSSNTFTQIYKSAPSSNGSTWTEISSPSGPCGIVQLNRFEAVKPNESSQYNFWKYIARKAVTVPNGELLFGGSCSQLDQSEYVYDWKEDGERQLGCDYIEFSAI